MTICALAAAAFDAAAQATRADLQPDVIASWRALDRLNADLAAGRERLAMGCTVQPPVVQARCPPLRDYSPAQSIALGEARAALRAREPGSILLTVVDDAFNLRERCRALEKK